MYGADKSCLGSLSIAETAAEEASQTIENRRIESDDAQKTSAHDGLRGGVMFEMNAPGATGCTQPV